ncbi:PIN domain-like protein [Obba rivulosa]|uniref:PIN domain-like protein n=1 Tax=Obba rivulosa TaxID=1052685 RepID=A0A8E2DTG5_9APHY|nr:PIN domain-like protein [Obba rivulosa]
MGVKSLWSLLDPVGRPVLLETMEGKAMAIDSSIWIYQFQATMRDKEGRGLVNAHVLGFLRRICKLLFYGIKPVFVFDGGAPVLKRATIAERKSKKSGAAASHTKVAERLLAAQMRREAVNQVQKKSLESSRGKGKVPTGPVVLDENTVYLEDIDNSVPKTPSKKSAECVPKSPPSSKKKSRWHDHDPYKLPELDLGQAVAKATSSAVPDPRLATEDELRAFIEEMRPEDFDVSSPAFRELPTEVQYEIIGDLRLKSRQTSYKRLQNMLRKAKTPLDFSKEQIKNLKQRNSLTQQLLTTTDSIGKAHVSIPIRIASERNKEYVLIKNESGEGGWVLGIRDQGTRSKPIEIDHTSDVEKAEDDSDAEMQEVAIPEPVPYDADLREHRRIQALSALAERYSPKKLAPLTTKPMKKPTSRPLFDLDDEDQPDGDLAGGKIEYDTELSQAIQESLELQEESHFRQALEASRTESTDSQRQMHSTQGASSSALTLDLTRATTPDRRLNTSVLPENSDDDDLYVSPTRLETALSIAGAGPSRRPPRSFLHDNTTSSSPISPATFGVPSLLLSTTESELLPVDDVAQGTESEDDMEEVPVSITAPALRLHDTPAREASPQVIDDQGTMSTQPATLPVSDSDEDMEEVLPTPAPMMAIPPEEPASARRQFTPTPRAARPSPMPMAGVVPVSPPSIRTPSLLASTKPSEEPTPANGVDVSPDLSPPGETRVMELSVAEDVDDSDNDDDAEPRSSSPFAEASGEVPSADAAPDDWDAAQEMNPQAEEGEFARFISQVKGKDIETVQREIDEEIRALNQQKKAAMRDSEDITQQMVSQIMVMLRLFGIPYITAPMEAEAQCAELLSLGLVDGIITDDSDVFLFGGQRVLKNMFNQSKTVECYLLPDLDRELGLDRDKLIRLAYLLGSDYTEGLPGVGPVVAMELLTEFSGQDGLHKFKDWWQKVQSGRDTEEDTKNKFRRRFKKRFKELYLPSDWPNPAVRDAYYHPTVDESEEPFKWGLPDLDALRDYFNAELGWHQGKVDDLLLPIIRKMGKRGQSSALNKQGNLNGFFDLPLGGESHAPRKRQAYASKRLQQVVSDFRKEQAKARSRESTGSASGKDASPPSDEEEEARPSKKRKTNAARRKAASRGKPRKSTGGRTKTSTSKKAVSASDGGGSVDGHSPSQTAPSPPAPRRSRPKPRPVGRAATALADDDDNEYMP